MNTDSQKQNKNSVKISSRENKKKYFQNFIAMINSPET